MPGPLDAMREHHGGILKERAAGEATAEALTPEDLGRQRDALRRAVTFLLQDLLPHAQGEERALYPAVEPLIKQHGEATAPYKREHRFLEGAIDDFRRDAE